MVRLKVDMISARAGLDVISIPYGAIKRHKKKLWKHKKKLISIPYGAIKSRRHRLLKMA